jgi:hypothetical protein
MFREGLRDLVGYRGRRRRIALDAMEGDLEGQGLEVAAVHEALDPLAALDGRSARDSPGAVAFHVRTDRPPFERKAARG